MALLSPPTLAPGYKGELHHFVTKNTMHSVILSAYSPQALQSSHSRDHFPSTMHSYDLNVFHLSFKKSSVLNLIELNTNPHKQFRRKGKDR